jgi:hypothetical protein
LDGIFNKNIGGLVNTSKANADGLFGTTDIYRYATIDGLLLALPTLGGAGSTPYGPAGARTLQPGTAVGNAATPASGSNVTNTTYNDLLAVWDAHNGTDTVNSLDGTPAAWRALDYWAATPSQIGHTYVSLNSGGAFDLADTNATAYAALQVLNPTATFSALASESIWINGVNIGDIAAAGSAVARSVQIAAAINAQTSSTGVIAVADTFTGGVSLKAGDGRNIEISTLSTAAITADNTGLALSGTVDGDRSVTTVRSSVDLNSTISSGMKLLVTSEGALATGLAEQAPKLTAFTSSQVASLTLAQVAALSVTSIKVLTSSQYPAMRTDQIAALTTVQVSSLETADLVVLKSTQVAAITPAGIAALTTAEAVAFTTEQITALGAAQLIALPSATLNALTTDHFMALRPAQIAAFKTTQVAGLETQDLAALSTAQVVAITAAGVTALTTAQITALTAEQTAALTTAQVRAMRSEQVGALETQDLAAMLTTQIGALSTLQVSALSTQHLASLGTKQVSSLTKAQLLSLSSERLNSLDTNQFRALRTDQIAVLSTAQVAGHHHRRRSIAHHGRVGGLDAGPGDGAKHRAVACHHTG